MMKYVGYIKRFDPRIPESRDLEEMFEEQKLGEILRNNIIDYLSAGHFLLGWMSILCEEDGTLIGYNNVYTDGCYVWPLYYPYYLKKYLNVKIDERFIDHVKNNNFIMPQLSKDDLVNLDKQYTLAIQNLNKHDPKKPSGLL